MALHQKALADLDIMEVQVLQDVYTTKQAFFAVNRQELPPGEFNRLVSKAGAKYNIMRGQPPYPADKRKYVKTDYEDRQGGEGGGW